MTRAEKFTLIRRALDSADQMDNLASAGPFPTEDNHLDLPELHNGTGEFQGAFRVGTFDWKTAAKAIDIVGGVDYLAISHMDYLSRLGTNEENFVDAISQFAPIGMLGRGPTAAHRTVTLEHAEAYV